MIRKTDTTRKKYIPLLDKNLKAALSHCIGTQFPRLGGERIRTLCAEMILEVVDEHIRPTETMQHAQALWLAVSVDDPPARGKTMRETDLVPVVLDLSTPEDIESIINRNSPDQRLLNKCIRLCTQAFEQGGLLSNIDLGELLGCRDQVVSRVVSRYERDTGKVVPRRATIHDVGTAITHKRIICLKFHVEGKSADQVARETHHSLQAVDRYLSQFDRVRHCWKSAMTLEQTAFMLQCSISLVRQYLDINQEIEESRHA